MCAGVAGWGAAQLVGEPGYALPALARGLLSGSAVMTLGCRRAHRDRLAAPAAGEVVAPLLSMTENQGEAWCGPAAGRTVGRNHQNGWAIGVRGRSYCAGSGGLVASR